MSDAVLNTDKQIWRKPPGDYYQPSIHVTQGNGVGINVGGHVIVAPVEDWHQAGETFFCVDPRLPWWRWKLAMWLLARRPVKNKEIRERGQYAQIY